MSEPEQQRAEELTRDEVARLIDLSRRQVDRLLRSGELTGTKRSGRVKIFRWSVDAFLAGRPIGE